VESGKIFTNLKKLKKFNLTEGYQNEIGDIILLKDLNLLGFK